MQRALRVTAWTCNGVCAALLIWCLAGGGFQRTLSQVMLTLVGIGMGIAMAELYLREPRPHSWFSRAGLSTIVGSQLCYHLLVWTSLNEQTLLWRCWWLTTIPSLNLIHLLILGRAGFSGSRWARSTRIAIPVLGLLLIGLVLRPKAQLVETPALWVLVLIALPATVCVLGSCVAAFRWHRSNSRREPWPPLLRYACILTSQVLLFLGGFYLGTVSHEPPSPFDLMPSALASVSRAELAHQLQTDLLRLKTIAVGLDDLEAQTAQLHARIFADMKREGRTVFTPAEEDEIRWRFVSYLSYRAALVRMIAVYSGFESVRDPEQKIRCFLLGYAAGATALDVGIKLVERYRDRRAARAKLNEPDAAWGVKEGMFDEIYYGVTNPRNVAIFEEFAQYFAHKRAAWRKAGIHPKAEMDWLEARIDRCTAEIRKSDLDQTRAWLSRVIKRVKQDAYTPVYSVQTLVSGMIGDFRISDRQPFIADVQIAAVQKKIQPGDIIIERRNWFLSNAFLPGFWPHAALYVGTPEELRALGLAEHPEIRAKWDLYARKAHDGRQLAVIEAVSEGVIFNSLHHSIHADYVAVLRPRLAKEQIKQAIVNAFRHHGKAYDFEFDFATSDKLVCTELVYRSYSKLLRFDLINIMGRRTLPALEIVKKFAAERGSSGRQLDFVLFLDTPQGGKQARFASEEEFCSSASRPRAFHN